MFAIFKSLSYICIMKEINIDILTSITNRTLGQTKFLLELLNDDYEKLLLLERKLKNNFLSFCPGTKKEIEKILSINNDRTESYNWMTLDLIENISKYDNIVQHKLSKKYGTVKRILKEKKGLYPDQYGIYWLGNSDNVPIMKHDWIFFPYDQVTMPYWCGQEMVYFITNKHELSL